MSNHLYLLYADESGTTHNATEQYFVLAGFCVFERQGYWIAKELDNIAARFNPGDPSTIELHGSPIISGRGPWRQFKNYETTIQTLATDFRTIGHKWGVIRNFSEVPLFLDSKASRLIQLADIIAYAIFRYFERGDDTFYSIIKDRFDEEGGIVHGLFVRQ